MSKAEIVYTTDQIHARVRELAGELERLFEGKRPLLISVLKGSVIFFSDLVRYLEVEPDIDFMSISSYQAGGEKTGVVRIVKDLEEPIEGRDVVVVEDIVDTGLSLSYLLRTLETRNPASIRICSLIDKNVMRIADLQVDLAGFQTEDFLIGYGLDFKGRYRNLPFIAALADVSTLPPKPEGLEWLFED